MRYEPGEPTVVTFETSDELQAIGWAASEMRRAEPDNSDNKIAFKAALRATEIRHNGSDDNDFTLHGKKADALLSVVQRWVAAGPPAIEGQVTDAARAKSYKTARALVEQVIEFQ
jgi:hypothetical protein